MFNKKSNGRQKINDSDEFLLLDSSSKKKNDKIPNQKPSNAIAHTFMSTFFLNDANFFVDNLLNYYNKICGIMVNGNPLEISDEIQSKSKNKKIQE